MGVKKEALILVVKNPYAHDLKYSEAGELLTTKKDSQRHGYGLKINRKGRQSAILERCLPTGKAGYSP